MKFLSLFSGTLDLKNIFFFNPSSEIGRCVNDNLKQLYSEFGDKIRERFLNFSEFLIANNCHILKCTMKMKTFFLIEINLSI